MTNRKKLSRKLLIAVIASAFVGPATAFAGDGMREKANNNPMHSEGQPDFTRPESPHPGASDETANTGHINTDKGKSAQEKVDSPSQASTMGLDQDSTQSTLVQVQRKLNDKGYEVVADGVMGKNTRKALKKYQEAQGLEETGQINEETLSAMSIQADGLERSPASADTPRNLQTPPPVDAGMDDSLDSDRKGSLIEPGKSQAKGIESPEFERAPASVNSKKNPHEPMNPQTDEALEPEAEALPEDEMVEPAPEGI